MPKGCRKMNTLKIWYPIVGHRWKVSRRREFRLYWWPEWIIIKEVEHDRTNHAYRSLCLIWAHCWNQGSMCSEGTQYTWRWHLAKLINHTQIYTIMTIQENTYSSNDSRFREYRSIPRAWDDHLYIVHSNNQFGRDCIHPVLIDSWRLYCYNNVYSYIPLSIYGNLTPRMTYLLSLANF